MESADVIRFLKKSINIKEHSRLAQQVQVPHVKHKGFIQLYFPTGFPHLAFA